MTREQLLEKGRQAETAQELKAMAENEGIALTGEQADAYFQWIHNGDGNRLSDAELEAITGGFIYVGKPTRDEGKKEDC